MAERIKVGGEVSPSRARATKARPSSAPESPAAAPAAKPAPEAARPDPASAPDTFKAGPPRLAQSAKLLETVLEADRASYESLDPTRANTLRDRDLAKRIGMLLQMTPYGAPTAVILRRIQEDPFVQQRLPGVTMTELRVLHDHYPNIVPRPNLPVDVGPAYSPTREGYLDLYASQFVASSSRAALAKEQGAEWTKAFANRYVTDGGSGLALESHFPQLHVICREADKIAQPLGRAGFFLRRAIVNAPPHWGPAQIAEEHNRYLEYFGPLLYWGDKDSLAAAKERGRVTPDHVRQIMAKFPVESGATELALRQQAFRDRVTSGLRAAQSGDNLYATLEQICAQLEQSPVRAQEKPFDPRSSWLVFKPSPSVSATVRPEDLVDFISSEPALSEELDALMARRRDGLDRTLAEGIVQAFGDRLERWTVEDIVRVMHQKDPVYNEPLVRHLLASFPELFGAAKVERHRVEMKFLLANKVADAMQKMFPGAGLEDVAAFLRSQGPSFNDEYPDFSGADVRLLQAAYPFLPQWERKPQSASSGSTGAMPLEAFAQFATQQLGAASASRLREALLSSLGGGMEADAVPANLRATVDLEYTRALLHLVSDALKVRDRVSLSGHDIQRYDAYRYFLAADPKGRIVDQAALVSTLTEPGIFNLPKDRASRIATALMQAQARDFIGLADSMSALLMGRPDAEIQTMRLTNLALGYEGLNARLERDIFRNRDLKASFKRYARIPLRMPMVQSVVDKYKERQPLKDCNVLMVQHMLGQAYPQVSGYRQLGMDCKDCIFVGIPYHKNEEVEAAVAQSFGVDVRVPAKDMEALYQAIEKGVDDIVKKHRENGKPCLVVCDGPHARIYFDKKYPELAGRVRFTEQTAFGDRPEHRNDKSKRVVSYARTDLKKKEAVFVGQAVSRAVNAVLTQMGTGYEEKPILILGYGPIGISTAEAFAGDRAQIYVYDPFLTPEMEADARSKGYTVVKDKSQIAKGKFLLIGCAGHLSIDEEQILASDSNSIYVSASSKLVEIDMRKLRELATDEQGRIRRVLAAEVNDQQTWHYWLKDGTIRTVVADGLPANFNDINSVPPEFIDIAMSLGLAAAVQAMSGDELGYVSLNQEDADELYRLHLEMVEQMHREAKKAAGSEVVEWK